MNQESCVEVYLSHGKVTLPTTHVVVLTQTVTAPFVRVSGITSGSRVRSSTIDRQQAVGIVPQYGAFYGSTVSHREGAIILLQSSWKRGGAAVRDGAVFLRLRRTGAAYSIKTRIPLDRGNTIGDSTVIFEGRADLLTYDELEGLGIVPHDYYRGRFMDPTEVDECFIISQDSPEVSRPPRLELAERNGEKVLVPMARTPKRRMILKR